MGVLAFALIGGPWVALIALLWLRRDEGGDMRVEVFQGGSGPHGGTSPSSSGGPASIPEGKPRMGEMG